MIIVSFFRIPPRVKYDPARPGRLERGPPPSPPPIPLPQPPPPLPSSSLDKKKLLLEQDLNVTSSSSSSGSSSSGSSNKRSCSCSSSNSSRSDFPKKKTSGCRAERLTGRARSEKAEKAVSLLARRIAAGWFSYPPSRRSVKLAPPTHEKKSKPIWELWAIYGLLKDVKNNFWALSIFEKNDFKVGGASFPRSQRQLLSRRT